MDYRETISLKDLKLKLPNLTSHAEKKRIIYKKDESKERVADIIIVGRTLFTFLFCFTNRYNKHHPLANALKAEPHFGRLSMPATNWLPPHWVVFPVRNTTSTYRLTAVSWDNKYKKRFSKEDKTDREKIRDSLLQKKLEKNQGSIFD